MQNADLPEVGYSLSSPKQVAGSLCGYKAML